MRSPIRLGVVLKNAALGAALVACVAAPPVVGTSGQLGNGTFSYICADLPDTACTGLRTAFIPTAVAVGATIDVSFRPNDTATVVLAPAAPQMLVPGREGRFQAARPGQTALLASFSGGAVLDFVHIRLAKVDHFLIKRASLDSADTDGGSSIDAGPPDSSDAGDSTDGGSAAVQLQLSTPTFVEAQPMDRRHVILAGALPFTWTSSNKDIVEVSGKGSSAHLFPVGVGSATIAVSAGGAETTFPVTVTEMGP